MMWAFKGATLPRQQPPRLHDSSQGPAPMIFPYSVDVPMTRWPIANWVIMAGCCLATFVLLTDESGDMLGTFVLFRGEEFSAVQLVGGLFGHGDPMHLIGNMLFMFVFGNAVNAKVGNLVYPALFLLIGVLES